MLDQIQHEIRDQTSAQPQQEAKQKLTWRAFQEAEHGLHQAAVVKRQQEAMLDAGPMICLVDGGIDKLPRYKNTSKSIVHKQQQYQRFDPVVQRIVS